MNLSSDSLGVLYTFSDKNLSVSLGSITCPGSLGIISAGLVIGY